MPKRDMSDVEKPLSVSRRFHEVHERTSHNLVFHDTSLVLRVNSRDVKM